MKTNNFGHIGQGAPPPGSALGRSAQLARILAHVRKRLEAPGASVRSLAKEIGVSKSTLSDLLTGKPRVRLDSFPRLIAWYDRALRRQEGALEDPVDAGILLSRMLDAISEEKRRTVLRSMLDAAAAACDEQQVPRPSWVDPLRAALAPAPAGDESR